MGAKIELTNEDCMDLMARYPDKYFELAIVDPPYGIGADNFRNGEGAVKKGNTTSIIVNKNRLSGSGKLKNRNKSGCSWDLIKPNETFFKELFRLSLNQIIWGGNYFILPTTRGIIAWDKEQPWENFSAWEMAWTSFDVPAKLFKYRIQGYSNKQDCRIHPTQKPVKLYEWLLKNYAKQGDKILDTHLGSGSIAIACYNLEFDLTGCEIDKDYYEAAVKRLEEHKRQQRLFEKPLPVQMAEKGTVAGMFGVNSRYRDSLD